MSGGSSSISISTSTTTTSSSSSSSWWWWEEYKPVLAMVTIQFIYAIMSLSAKAAFTEGMSPLVFVVYRQAIAALFLLLSMILAKGGIRRHLRPMGLGMRGFSMVVLASLIGSTLSLFFYFVGLRLTSSTVATAMINLVPPFTFVMAACCGVEKVRCNVSGMAKVLGTVVSLAGALCLTFFRGPKVLSLGLQNIDLYLSADPANKNWVVGSFLLLVCCCCWSSWLILQETICKHYHLEPLSLATWMCLLSAFMSAALTFVVEPNLTTWKITSLLQLFSSLFAGIFASGVCYYLQSWAISVRGSLFAAIFNPLCNLITTILASIILKEKLYVGSLVGAAAIVGGLYTVLLGKSGDLKPNSNSQQEEDGTDARRDEGPSLDLTRPLFSERSSNV